MELRGTAAPEWPDRDLVVAFKAGERWAYDEMYRRYGARVEGICRRMLGNVEDAHEATQETFLKAYQGLPRFNGNYKLGAWLSRIAANVCLDQIRARGRRATLVPLPSEDAAHEVDPGPEDLVASGDRAFSTLDEIQPLHAQALALRAIEGMSHKEMAYRLDMSPQQVKALLHRARDSFKRAWESASGWLVAPLIGLRSVLSSSEKSGTAGAPAVLVGSSATPLLAEKVAASAIVVAAALSGMTTGDSDVSPPPNLDAVVVESQDVEEVEAPPATVESKVASIADKSVVDDVAALLEEVQESTEDEGSEEKKGDGDGDGDNGGLDPDDPRKAGTKVVKTVKEQIDDVIRY